MDELFMEIVQGRCVQAKAGEPTPRQLEVGYLWAIRGLSVPQLAEHFGFTRRSAENHLYALRQKVAPRGFCEGNLRLDLNAEFWSKKQVAA